MMTFIADIIPKLQRFSQKLDNQTKLTNQNWVSLGEIGQTKRVFIFDNNGSLDIYENGIEIDTGTWKFVNDSLRLKLKTGGLLLKHGFFDENVIALKLDSSDKYAFFINETLYKKELNTIEDVLSFLEDRYLKKTSLGSQNIPLGTIHYRISNEYDTITLRYGTCRVYEITFSYGVYGKVFLKKSNNKFWYHDEIYGEQEADTLEKAITYLYKSIQEKHNR